MKDLGMSASAPIKDIWQPSLNTGHYPATTAIYGTSDSRQPEMNSYRDLPKMGCIGLAALILLAYNVYKVYKVYNELYPFGTWGSIFGNLRGPEFLLEPLNVITISLLLGLLLIMVLSVKGNAAAYEKATLLSMTSSWE